MDINQKKIILAVIAILSILFAVFLASKFIKRKQDQTPDQNPPGKITRETRKGVYYIGDHLVGSPDIATENECAKKENDTQKEDCYNRLKLGQILNGSKNLKECLAFTDLSYKNRCFERLISNYHNDPGVCERISDYSAKERCAGNMAIKLKDKNLCDEFKSEPYEYQECVDRVDAFSAPASKKGALGEIGEVEEVEVKECAKIKTLEYSKLCVGNVLKDGKMFVGSTDNSKFLNNYNDFYYYRIAATEEDCGKIVLKGAKEACLKRIKHPEFTYFDFDKDGINDDKELWFSTDPGNPDTDGDGLGDREEVLDLHLNPTQKDTDGDGLSDYDEVKKYKTHPNKPDTDGDGILDGEEIKKGANPATGDDDKDRLSNIDEDKFKTDKNNPDTDGDGMSDLEETRNGFDPLKPGQDLADTDSDGLLDIDEIFYGTDRFKIDTDSDGASDKQEVDNLTNPIGSGDMDFDGDGISDKNEKTYGTNPTLGDSDGDGLFDYDEIFKHKTDPNKKDTDKDGYSDGDEVKRGYNPLVKGK